MQKQTISYLERGEGVHRNILAGSVPHEVDAESPAVALVAEVGQLRFDLALSLVGCCRGEELVHEEFQCGKTLAFIL